MKTPVLMKVGNSAVLQVFRKTPQNRGWPHCPRAVSKAFTGCCRYGFWGVVPRCFVCVCAYQINSITLVKGVHFIPEIFHLFNPAPISVIPYRYY